MIGFLDGRWDVAVFVDNVTDERALLALDQERGTRARVGNSPPACTCTKPSAGSAWPKVTNGSKMVTPWPSPSGESGSHPDDPARQCARGHRRGCNTLRARAPIRGETGSLETAPSATQSWWCSRSGIALGQPRVFPWISGAFSRRGRGAGEARHARSEVAAGEQAIVSRAGFRGPGWTFPWHPPAEGGDGGSGCGTSL